jgi:site-specific DNA recombinase
MKSAYLYLRVSTDEQKRKGYSLPEQEDRLLKYCEGNGIKVKGIYREDFSAKNFIRPEWKKLISEIKKNKERGENNILFVRWDRFSRNIQYAYETIGFLRKYNTNAMAIDQPVDLGIPESSVMLAVYLAIPEAENTRRALNTANGMRRAKLMGRYPNKAPVGFVNLTSIEGRKFIAPKWPEAGIIQWIFKQLSKNLYSPSEVRRMALAKGFNCTRSYFFKIIRNPVYCGLITLSTKSGESELVEGNHEALVNKSLFYEVQDIINSKRKVCAKNTTVKEMFYLRSFMTCPLCGHIILGSFSRRARSRYPYYHCRNRCATRVSARLVNLNYENNLQHYVLFKGAIALYNKILDEVNLDSIIQEYSNERASLLRQLSRGQKSLSRARNLFVEDILKLDDYNEFKGEILERAKCLKKEIAENMDMADTICQQRAHNNKRSIQLFKDYSSFDTADKKQLATIIPPQGIDFTSGNLSIQLPDALKKILVHTSIKT